MLNLILINILISNVVKKIKSLLGTLVDKVVRVLSFTYAINSIYLTIYSLYDKHLEMFLSYVFCLIACVHVILFDLVFICIIRFLYNMNRYNYCFTNYTVISKKRKISLKDQIVCSCFFLTLNVKRLFRENIVLFYITYIIILIIKLLFLYFIDYELSDLLVYKMDNLLENCILEINPFTGGGASGSNYNQNFSNIPPNIPPNNPNPKHSIWYILNRQDEQSNANNNVTIPCSICRLEITEQSTAECKALLTNINRRLDIMYIIDRNVDRNMSGNNLAVVDHYNRYWHEIDKEVVDKFHVARELKERAFNNTSPHRIHSDIALNHRYHFTKNIYYEVYNRYSNRF